MTLLPEQTRALAYARKRGTDAPLREIVSRVSRTFDELENLVATVTEEVAREHRASSRWCILEVLDHLIESDGPAARQLERALTGADVAEPIPAHLQSAAPHDLDWQTVQRALRAVHDEVLGALGRASDESPQTARVAVEMVVKCAQPDGTLAPVTWIEAFDWKAFAILIHAHNQEHIAQVRRILGSPPGEPLA